MKLLTMLLLSTILPLAGSCSHESEAPPAASPAASSGGKPASPPVVVPPAASGLAFTAQEGWVTEKPTSAMRKAQYRLPHADKDAEDASLVVYFFGGGQGGDVQSNLDRWCSQFEQPDGKASKDVLKNSSRTVNGMTVHEADLSGTYVAETAPGSGEHVRKEGWRMLAAILEAKDGPYYAKLVGPSATIAKWEESFRNFVNAAKPAP